MASSTFNIHQSAPKEQPYLSEVRPEEHAFILLRRTHMRREIEFPEKTEETMAMVRRRVQRLRAA